MVVAFPARAHARSYDPSTDRAKRSRDLEGRERAAEPFEVHFPSEPIVAAPRQADESADDALDRIFGTVDRAAHPFETRTEARSVALAAANTWFAAAQQQLAQLARQDAHVQVDRRRAQLARELDTVVRTVQSGSAAAVRRHAELLGAATRALGTAQRADLDRALTSPLHPAPETVAPGAPATTALMAPTALCKPRTDRTGEAGANADAAVKQAVAALSGGQPLGPEVREAFEGQLAAAGMAADLSEVRIHTGPSAEALCDTLGARAVAIGAQIAFAAGQHAPGSASGQALLAHELVHVAQAQTEVLPSGVVPANSPLEAQADAVAAQMMAASQAVTVEVAAAPSTAAAPARASHSALLLKRDRYAAQEAVLDDMDDDANDPASWSDKVADARTLFQRIATHFEGRDISAPPAFLKGIGDVAPVAPDELSPAASKLVLEWRRLTEIRQNASDPNVIPAPERLARIKAAEADIVPFLALLCRPEVIVFGTNEWLQQHYFGRVEREKRRAERGDVEADIAAHEAAPQADDLDGRVEAIQMIKVLTDAKDGLEKTVGVVNNILGTLEMTEDVSDVFLSELKSTGDQAAVLALAPGSSTVERMQAVGAYLDLGISIYNLADPTARAALFASKRTSFGKLAVGMSIAKTFCGLATSVINVVGKTMLCVGRLTKNAKWIEAAIGGDLMICRNALVKISGALDLIGSIATLLDPDATTGQRIEAGISATVDVLTIAEAAVATPIAVAVQASLVVFNGLASEGGKSARGPVIGELRHAMFPKMAGDAKRAGEVARKLESAFELRKSTTDAGRRAALEGIIATAKIELAKLLSPYVVATRWTGPSFSTKDPATYGPKFSHRFMALLGVPLIADANYPLAARTFIDIAARCVADHANLTQEVADWFVAGRKY